MLRDFSIHAALEAEEAPHLKVKHFNKRRGAFLSKCGILFSDIDDFQSDASNF